jgi:pre-mRNA-processing factor 17
VGEHATLQIVGDLDNAEKQQGMTIFETSKTRSGEKRKKEKNYDSSDVEGFQGPWAPFAEEITVSRPSEVCFI